MTESCEDVVAPRSSAQTDKIHVVDPCTSPAWMQFISSHPDAGIFHHPAWMTMLRDVYGFRMFAACVKDGEKIRAGIPFADVRSFLTGDRWVSLPFSDYCAPLFPHDDPDCVETMISFLRNQQHYEQNRIEMRWHVQSPQPMYRTRDFVLHTLALEKNYDAVMKRFDRPSVTNRVAKSRREGVVVRECRSQHEFEEFYRLQLLTRRRLGVPAQPEYFFDAVWNYIIEPGLGFALISFKDATPIGGGVFFKFGSTVSYKYGASDFAYKKLQPNHAYICEAIRRSCEEGYRVFDFGRSDADNAGLRRFKSGWGTVEQPLAYTTIGDAAPKPCSSSRLDTIASFVIRNSPPVVCKLTGQLLYKHFA